MARKGDFSKQDKITLARRVNDHCSNPNCPASTAGPHLDPEKYVLNGEAAHIHSASERGPRYNKNLSLEEVSSIENGIWLCCNCHTIVDPDHGRYTAEELKEWKKQAEDKANSNQIKPINRKADGNDTKLKKLWVHETTNDKDYIPRNIVLNKLDTWAKSQDTKVITITGIGGQGKTSLIGYWLKEAKALTNRKFDGLFYWSFYSEQDTTIFFKSLIKFASSNFNCELQKINQTDLLNSLRYIFSEFSICVILDGLEVIQYELSNRAKGQFVDGDLRNFLIDLCLSKNDSLAILTSRFEIVDLRQFSKQVKNLPLGNLSDSEASLLLQRLYVGGTVSDHSSINVLLEGHPLALRVFAAGIPREKQGNPMSHLNSMMDTLAKGESALSEKINRLLSTYEKSINVVQIALLSGVSILHKPIDENSLLLLSAKQLEKSSSTENVNSTSMKTDLSSLVVTGLVLKELVSGKCRYSCHPIIRDYFRSKVTNNNEQGHLVGEFLAKRPGELKIEDNETLEWIVSAIEVLSECGNWFDASYLYEDKLEDGLMLKKLAKPEYGWRCALALSKASKRQVYMMSIFEITPPSVKNTQSFYLNAAGQFSLMMGDLVNTVDFYKQALDKLGKSASLLNRSVAYDGLASASIQSGELYNAFEYLKQSIELASQRNPDVFFLNQLHISRGQLHLLSGELVKARIRYQQVYGSFKGNQKKNTDLKACSAYGLAEVALNNFEHDIAAQMIGEGRQYAEINNRQDLLLLGHYLRGRLLYEIHDVELANVELQQAERIARQSRMEYWIIKISIVQSMVYSKLGLIEKASITIEDCIEVSSSRKFDILKVDSLIAKTVNNISDEKKDQILDYLIEAKMLAENLGYHLVFEIINALENLLKITK